MTIRELIRSLIQIEYLDENARIMICDRDEEGGLIRGYTLMLVELA